MGQDKRSWPTNGTIVEVEWIDSASTNGWQGHDVFEEEAGLIECRSTGYLISKDRVSVKIEQSQSNHGSGAELLAIPRSCVTAITVLKSPKMRRKPTG